MAYAVRVSSNLGTMLKTYSDFCRKTFGRKGSTWDVDSYMWAYVFYFNKEEDATLFTLKWAGKIHDAI